MTTSPMTRRSTLLALGGAITTALLTGGRPAAAQTAAPEPATLLSNVRIFDGLNDQLRPGHLLILGDKIAEVSEGEIQPPEGARVIDGAALNLQRLSLDRVLEEDGWLFLRYVRT